jgi:RNase adaptor protein for sRNA GlmZ degradation
MTGIQYVTDEEGRKIAVQIDLREHAELWEEFEDVLISQSRRNEESIPIEQVEAKLIQRGKLSA